MTSLLYYSIARNLTANEKIEIDHSVDQNRKAISKLVTNLSVKRTIIGVSILKLICFDGVSTVSAITIPNPVMMKIEPKEYEEYLPEIQKAVVLF